MGVTVRMNSGGCLFARPASSSRYNVSLRDCVIVNVILYRAGSAASATSDRGDSSSPCRVASVTGLFRRQRRVNAVPSTAVTRRTSCTSVVSHGRVVRKVQLGIRLPQRGILKDVDVKQVGTPSVEYDPVVQCGVNRMHTTTECRIVQDFDSWAAG